MRVFGVFFVSMFLTFTASAKTMIVSAIQYRSAAAPTIYIGFSDSSFDYDTKNPKPESKSYCYVGDVNEVCSQIQMEVRRMQAQYASGAHDTIDLKSCKVEENPVSSHSKVVRAIYTLSDDYGTKELPVDRLIKACL